LYKYYLKTVIQYINIKKTGRNSCKFKKPKEKHKIDRKFKMPNSKWGNSEFKMEKQKGGT
jgi:hypothetical protein